MLNNPKITYRKDCRLCHKTNFNSILNLGKSALANEFVSDPNIEQETYPLELFQCQSCFHYQLRDIVNSKLMFKEYNYVSGTSNLMRDHFNKYANEVHNHNFDKLGNKNIIVDIGSNDGTLLKEFKNLGYKVLGVDPAENLAQKANEEGIETIPEFFNVSIAKNIVKKYDKASVITCNNCFAHVDNLDEIVNGVKELLDNNGIFVIEVSSFDKMVLETNDFSQIYHEHVSYHQLPPLENFFKRFDMHISHVEKIDVHGGSLRIYVRHGTSKQDWYNMTEKIINMQHKFEFRKNISNIKKNIKQKLLDLKSQSKAIAGVTASAKSTTFLHYCDIGNDILDFICDDAPEKQGKFSPGKHIPILPFSAIKEKKPDYLLLLSFNFANFIMEKYSDYNGIWINPLPKLKMYQNGKELKAM